MQRLLIVSNRLPINVSRGDGDEKWKFQLSSGGLVSALSGVQKSTKFVWIGWPGLDIDEGDRKLFTETILREHSSLPVFIDQNTSNLHYNGFSNSTIWPLFHYLPADITISEEHWQGYKKANRIFANYIAEVAQNGDIIWVHDYHLMLLPQMLRETMKLSEKNVKIGFFLHIPFPTSEVYRVLPYRKEVLVGILNSDLIGFHTYDYARHFLTSCTRILGSNTSPTSVDFENRTIKVGAYPVGVQPEKFEESLKQKETCIKIGELEEKYKGLKIIIGVERLDYIKGLTQKLLAFEEFLEDNPEFIGKVILIQIAIPSRTDVSEYQRLQNQVFELIGRINGKFSKNANISFAKMSVGSLNYSPVQFLYNSVNFTELVALYRIADVCLVTSARDGMNLVACEYIASQIGKHGVLVLSEFAGCSQSLNGAILINPWNLNEIKNAIRVSLTVSDSQKISDHSHLLSYVKRFTSSNWGKTFVEDLASCNVLQLQLHPHKLFEKSGSKLFVANDTSTIKELISKQTIICGEKDSYCVLSQSPKSECSQISKEVIVFAEHGFYQRSVDGVNWSKSVNGSNIQSISNLAEALLKVLNYYSKRVPFSKILAGEELICWKFEGTDQTYAEWISSELQMNLEKIIGHLPLKVQRSENELRIMHATTDLVSVVATVIKNLNRVEKYNEIVFICKKYSELEKIAENLFREGLNQVRILSL